MFEGVTVAQSLTNPLRDTISDDESGVRMEVINMSKELFVPILHFEPHQYGFFISFTNNPINKYSGIYFILDSITENFNINMLDILLVARSYCNLRKLPPPQGVVPVSHMGLGLTTCRDSKAIIARDF